MSASMKIADIPAGATIEKLWPRDEPFGTVLVYSMPDGSRHRVMMWDVQVNTEASNEESRA